MVHRECQSGRAQRCWLGEVTPQPLWTFVLEALVATALEVAGRPCGVWAVFASWVIEPSNLIDRMAEGNSRRLAPAGPQQT
jgi:hypothetical protein